MNAEQKAAYDRDRYLLVIKGSHKLGRVNHGFSGEQVRAGMTMLDNVPKTMELVYCDCKNIATFKYSTTQ